MNHLTKVVAACSLCAASAFAMADTTVTLGLSGPLTGPQAGSGKDNENGAKLAIADLDRNGLTVGGQTVKLALDSEDDQGDPKVGVQIAQKLADSSALAILGPNNSGVAIPAARIFQGAGVAVLPVASNPALTAQGYDTIFRIGASDAQLGGSMADFAHDVLKARKVAVIDDRTAYGQGIAQEFLNEAQKLGLTVVGREYTSSNAVDFRAILTNLKAKAPDAIFYGGYSAQAGPMLKQMHSAAIPAKLLGGDGMCSAELPQLAGDASADAFCAQGGSALDKTAAGRAFIQRYRAAYHVDMLVYAANFYDGVMMVAKAMQATGTTTDRAKIRAYLAGISYDGIAGHYAFDANGNLKGAPTTVYTFRKNVLTPY
ncbi:branched-chain amino acid ABC transporter substrate-binding protein [Burkholderia plantarii]|uniref:Leu/Ile/Val-binding protein-like protein n=1 Tax=Burkholderia plantarii TaxID=41899 RepID=A0A0B6S8Y7_BURPL|nr:Leu/Ile/Val-binding protein-like protein [Burkholderia plantarii]ALK32960.1 Extracellular ligand-binding receptor [Burkholderia plantarii]WLE62037.1 branched-chain amino acid ABC transporter substrate-binding protein [Burkholderia plantarii]GLZ20397.1 branched chain amino acid ABC transporter substrate-binding protein [Burkholderia plantarii]